MKPLANLYPYENYQARMREKEATENMKATVSPNVTSRVPWSDKVLLTRQRRASQESPLKLWWAEQNKDRIYPDLRKEKFKAK